MPGIVPSGTINITENGIRSVKLFETANVQVPQGVFPEGTLEVTTNGVYNVTNYAATEVNVLNDVNTCNGSRPSIVAAP